MPHIVYFRVLWRRYMSCGGACLRYSVARVVTTACSHSRLTLIIVVLLQHKILLSRTHAHSIGAPGRLHWWRVRTPTRASIVDESSADAANLRRSLQSPTTTSRGASSSSLACTPVVRRYLSLSGSRLTDWIAATDRWQVSHTLSFPATPPRLPRLSTTYIPHVYLTSDPI